MTGKEARARRVKLGMTQTAFWARVKCTQSGGSRLEQGREINGPVQSLLTLAFGTDVQAAKEYERLRNG